MGASEILKILKNGGELTSLEISKQTECSIPSVKQAIKRLLKDISENLEFRTLSLDEKEKRYGYKFGGRVRVYWLNE